MIALRPTTRIWVHAQPTDMRKGFLGLAALVHHDMGHDLLEGDLFLFVSKRRNSAKVLMWDGTGLCLFSKRLARGCFDAAWLRSTGQRVEMSLGELLLFVNGAVRTSV